MEIFLASRVAKIIFVALRETEICSGLACERTHFSNQNDMRRLKGQKFVGEEEKKRSVINE